MRITRTETRVTRSLFNPITLAPDDVATHKVIQGKFATPLCSPSCVRVFVRPSSALQTLALAQVSWCAWPVRSRRRSTATYCVRRTLYRVSPMSSPTSPAIQSLLRLDRSSTNFGDQLHDVLYEQEYALHEENFKHDDLVWLVDYLDEVRPGAALLRSSLKPT